METWLCSRNHTTVAEVGFEGKTCERVVNIGPNHELIRCSGVLIKKVTFREGQNN